MEEYIEVDCFRTAAEERARLGLSEDSFDEEEIASGIAGAHLHAARLAVDAYQFGGQGTYPNNVPLIALAQPNGPEYVEQEGSFIEAKRPLSRITEKTEISDISYARPLAQETAYNQMMQGSLRSSTSTSSYGEVIGECRVP